MVAAPETSILQPSSVRTLSNSTEKLYFAYTKPVAHKNRRVVKSTTATQLRSAVGNFDPAILSKEDQYP